MCILALFATLGSHSPGAPTPPHDPARYASPDGTYELFVDPTDRRGQGPGNCRLRRGARELWAAQLPFTFDAAVVTDDGLTIGCGDVDPGFGLMFIDSQGEVRADHRIETLVHIMHGPGLPHPLGFVLQPELERCWLRVVDEGHEEEWWLYGLTTGNRERAVPIDTERCWSLRSARAIAGTELVLAEEWKNASLYHGGFFRLVDATGRTVWELQHPGDEQVLEEGRATSPELERHLDQHGTFLETSGPGRFDVWYVRSSERALFEVRSDANAESGWTVLELGREPYVPPITVTSVEPIELAARGVVQLASLDAPNSRDATIRRLVRPGPDRILGDGRICAQDLYRGALHVWDEAGAKLVVGTPDPEDVREANSSGRITPGLAGALFVQRESGHGFVGWTRQGERIGTVNRTNIAYQPGHAGPWVWSYRSSLDRLDDSGTVELRIDRRPDGRWLRHIEDVVFEADTIAVLTRPRSPTDPLPPSVERYTADGEPLETIDLPRFGRLRELHVHDDWFLTFGFGPHVLLIDRATHAAYELDVSEFGAGQSWTFGFSADGERLLALDAESLRLFGFQLL